MKQCWKYVGKNVKAGSWKGVEEMVSLIYNMAFAIMNSQHLSLSVWNLKKIWSQLKIPVCNGRDFHTPHTNTGDSGCHYTAFTCKAPIRDSEI